MFKQKRQYIECIVYYQTQTPHLGVPLVIRVNIKVVPCNDHESRGGELLLGNVYVHHGLLPQSILGNTSQEVPDDELIQTSFIALDTEETVSHYITQPVLTYEYKFV